MPRPCRERVDAFREQACALGAVRDDLRLLCTAPWPTYNFVPKLDLVEVAMLEPLPLGPSADLDAPAGGSRAEALQARYDKILANPGNLDEFIRELDGIEKIADVLPKRVNADPHNLENGLAQLVLTVIDLLRKLMERQAIRRREGGSLSDEEVERLGQTFMKLEEKMKELKETFGLGIATSTATSARWSNCFEKCRAIEDRLQSVCQKTRDLAFAMGTAGNDKEADPT